MKRKIRKYLEKNIKNLSDSKIIVFGGTGEIGVALIEELVYLNAGVVLFVRNIDKTNRIINDLKIKYPNSKIDLVYIDLASKDFKDVLRLQSNNINPTHIIINSGANELEEDLSYRINCYNPFNIIKNFKGVKTIVTSSISYKGRNNNDFYACHKRELMQLSYALTNEYDIVFVHPGIVYTNLFYNRNKKYRFIFPILKLFMPSTYNASLNIVYALNKRIGRNEWIGPKGIFKVFGYPGVSKLKKEVFEVENIEKVKKHLEEKERKYGL